MAFASGKASIPGDFASLPRIFKAEPGTDGIVGKEAGLAADGPGQGQGAASMVGPQRAGTYQPAADEEWPVLAQADRGKRSTG